MKQLPGQSRLPSTPVICWLLYCLLSLTGCGYHLVGHGGGSGTIPADTTTLTLAGHADPAVLSAFRQQLQSDRYTIVDSSAVSDSDHHTLILITMSAITFTPSAFDGSGIATQYRMTITGTVQVSRRDNIIWQSGAIQRQGDVFVTGGPTSIEASKQRLQHDLSQQWVSDAIGRLRSGF